jgi:hypothetical protein
MATERTAPPETDRDTIIVLARDQASFYEFVKPKQESGGRTVVVLDRREGERRRNGDGDGDGNSSAESERRQGQRRAETPEAALALMSVLGFMILHKDGDQWVP